MRNPVTMAPYEDFETGLTADRVPDLHAWVLQILRDPSMTPDQRRAVLALGAAKVLPHLPYSDAAREALADGTLCMLGEVPLPAWPRYTAPDYARLLQQGSEFLKLGPARDLHEALGALLSVYQYSATVTWEPVWIGNLDTLLEPYFDSVPPDEARRALRGFWTLVSRLYPSSFVHATLGPHASRVGNILLELDEEGVEPTNVSFRYDPAITPPDLARKVARNAMILSKPYLHNHAMSSANWGEEYAIASCFNVMAVGGGVHTLVRLNLTKTAQKATSPADMLENVIPAMATLFGEVIAARSQYLATESGFFKDSFLVQEGLLRLENFTAYAGIFGLAEGVDHLMTLAGRPQARYGHDAEANQLGADIISRLAACMAEIPIPFCEVTDGRAALHAQVGIDTDIGFTPGSRIPYGNEPEMYEHLKVVGVHDHWFVGGVSNIFEFEPTAAENPQAVLDIVKGAFALGCRNLAFGPSGGELIRISGYLMRRSDLAKCREGDLVRGDGAKLGTAVLTNSPANLHRRMRTV